MNAGPAIRSASASITLQGGPLPTVPDGPSANLGLAPLTWTSSPSDGHLGWELFNAGPDEAAGVVVVFALPAGVTYLDADVAVQTPPCPFDLATREVICTMPRNLSAGTTTAAVIRFSLDGVAAGTPVTVVATVRSDTPDPDPTDNVRSNTWGDAPAPSTTGVPAPVEIPVTGTWTSTMVVGAMLSLATGLAMIAGARRIRL